MQKLGYYSGFLQGNRERLIAVNDNAQKLFPVQMDKVRKKHFARKIEALEKDLGQLKASQNGINENHFKLETEALEKELERLRNRANRV